MAHHVNDVTLEPGNYTNPGDVTSGASLLRDIDPYGPSRLGGAVKRNQAFHHMD